jgi:Mce-associated membrane protein
VISRLSRLKRNKANGFKASGKSPATSLTGDEDQPWNDLLGPPPIGDEAAQPGLAEARVPDHDAVNPRDNQIDSASADAQSRLANVSKSPQRQYVWVRPVVYGLLPTLTMLVAVAVGYLKWHDFAIRELQADRSESVRAATDTTIKMLSYRPDTVEKDLTSARDLMTGTFRDSYTQLTHDVVIPGAKQRQISAVATVPAAAPVSASHSRAVVLVFVNQSIVVGGDAPSSTASSVKVTLNRVSDRWLISDFTPI